ncbi:hypothetical protein GCM10011387_00820 [Pedobacter quisquiliarum]|uniref:Uncharacterized protein n=1 Tax=Pedobacter quisquiliarum TaxID=1834438 RepID=A0A916TYQ3_9SPHI|nr:hypothetical protein GCM10011387_00820 [Pedobacter quisquiliarum]
MTIYYAQRKKETSYKKEAIFHKQFPDLVGTLVYFVVSVCGILCKWSTVLNLKVASIFKYNTR